MSREEFEKLLKLSEGLHLTDEMWSSIDFVLTHYPFPKECNTVKKKAEKVAQAYKLGPRYLLEMQATANSVKLVADRLAEISVEASNLKDVLDKLQSGDILTVTAVNGQLHAQWNPFSKAYQEMTDPSQGVANNG